MKGLYILYVFVIFMHPILPLGVFAAVGATAIFSCAEYVRRNKLVVQTNGHIDRVMKSITMLGLNQEDSRLFGPLLISYSTIGKQSAFYTFTHGKVDRDLKVGDGTVFRLYGEDGNLYLPVCVDDTIFNFIPTRNSFKGVSPEVGRCGLAVGDEHVHLLGDLKHSQFILEANEGDEVSLIAKISSEYNRHTPKFENETMKNENLNDRVTLYTSQIGIFNHNPPK